MKVLVTGAKGFVGQNLIAELRNRNCHTIYEFDLDTRQELLDEYCSNCDFVYSLAGDNRSQDQTEFMSGNGFASILLDTLKKYNNNCPVMLSSSVQASFVNPYGKSKKAGEVFIYRFPNIFGKWYKPNYKFRCNNFLLQYC